jgi:membrane protease YdiL (CAAX protease family)
LAGASRVTQPIKADPHCLSDASVLPTVFSDDGSAAPESVARRFCPTCGAPWQTEWSDCLACRGHSARRLAAEQSIQADPSFITSALALYFALLAASAAGIASGRARASVIIGLSIAHSGIFLAWSVRFRRAVVPALIRPFAIGWMPAAAGAGVLTFLLAKGLIAAMHRAFGLEELRMSDDFLHAGFGGGFVVLLVAVQPALFEELGFRGVILPALQPTLAVREAMVVSALLFMTLHLTVASFPHLFVLGLVLAFLRVRSRSLVPGMIMHFTHNLLCVWSEHHWG